MRTFWVLSLVITRAIWEDGSYVNPTGTRCELPSIRNVSFAVGAETGGATLQNIVQTAAAAQTLTLASLTYLFGQLRSDYANFVAFQVPTVFFSDSTGGCYHTTGDDMRVVSFPKLRQQSALSFRVTEALANQSLAPTFVPLGPLAIYADAQAIDSVLGVGVQDTAYLSPADIAATAQIKAQMDAIVADGPAAFDAADINTVLNAALTTVGALARVACQPF